MWWWCNKGAGLLSIVELFDYITDVLYVDLATVRFIEHLEHGVVFAFVDIYLLFLHFKSIQIYSHCLNFSQLQLFLF